MKQMIIVQDRDIRITGRLLRIAQLEGDGYEYMDDPEPVISGLRKSGSRVDLFTFMQKLSHTEPKFSYPIEWSNMAAVPVSTYDNWWKNQITSEGRNRARQAEKRGVVIREVPFDKNLVRGIWEIYNETPVRQGRRFPHYGKDFETVYAEEGTFLHSAVFIGAFLDTKLIGFVKLVHDETRTQANLMNILSLIEHRDKAPTNALIAHSVRTCADRGISYLVYQSFTYGHKQWDGIMKFKQVNGFQKMDTPRYYVALSPFGQLALRFQLHHRLVDCLPESIVRRLRELRNLWYSRRFQPAKQST
ncbi:MAG TPA: hypothetical protein VEX68_08910 [Bryobacteraceae bacterium]|nr:hypothetical protein [Bryobacteraceae bacterium]